MTDALPLIPGGFNRLKVCRHGPMLYNVNDVYIGRSLDLYGEYGEGETALFRQFVRPGDVVVDAGANIGAHTIFFAKRVGPAGAVLAFEPQRIVYQTLCANVALNSLVNAHCFQAALGEAPGSIVVPPRNYSRQDNFGGVSLGGALDGERVNVMTLDSLEAPHCRLLKVDVEGMEWMVLRGAVRWIERFRPILYIENDRPEKSAELIAGILGLGYRLYWHTPPLFQADNYFGNKTNVFGNIVSVNMAGIHVSQQVSVHGLVEVRGPEDRWQGA
nr:FkbM family methyltransferase [Nitrospirota bacterium]